MSLRNTPMPEVLKLLVDFDDGETVTLLIRLEYSKRRSVKLDLDIDTKTLNVYAPLNMDKARLYELIMQKRTWLQRQLSRVPLLPESGVVPEEAAAKRMTEQRVQAFLDNYDGIKPERISIRKQKSRWASYSSKGTLSVNYLAGFLSDDLFEYLMIHELMHCYELNHSAAFWALVEERIPDYKARRKQLRQFRLTDI